MCFSVISRTLATIGGSVFLYYANVSKMLLFMEPGGEKADYVKKQNRVHCTQQ